MDAGATLATNCTATKFYLTEQLDLANEHGNVEAAVLFQKQLAALEPASEEERAKDARYLSQRIVSRADRLKGVIAKLQAVATEATMKQQRLKEERLKDLSELEEAYETKRSAHAATYDEAIDAAAAAEKQAGMDIEKENAAHVAEDSA